MAKSIPMLIIAEQSPYWEEVALARKLIADGAIGSVVAAAGYYYESMRDNITSGVDAAGGTCVVCGRGYLRGLSLKEWGCISGYGCASAWVWMYGMLYTSQMTMTRVDHVLTD